MTKTQAKRQIKAQKIARKEAPLSVLSKGIKKYLNPQTMYVTHGKQKYSILLGKI